MHYLIPASALRLFTLLFVVSICSRPVYGQGIYQHWGTTAGGGPDDLGVIFSTDSSGGGLTGRYAFKYNIPGAGASFGGLAAFNGKLYGVCTGYNISSMKSSVFEYDPANGVYTRKVIFDASNGVHPGGGLTLCNNQFYGLTREGGANDVGVIFKYDPVTNVFSKQFDMTVNTGSYPVGGLTLFNGKLYGLTSRGGREDRGVIFEYDPITNIYTKKIDVYDGLGRAPTGSLTVYNNKLYGMTYGGVLFDNSTLFEYDPVSNIYTDKVDIEHINGKFPGGSLVVFNNKLWGTMYGGGINDLGVLFQYEPETGIYAKKIDFDVAGGATPQGALTVSGDRLLGLTSKGGANGLGVLFEYTPATNSYTKKIDLSSINGSAPAGDLFFFNNTFYGLTTEGGSAGVGVLFEYNPTGSVYTKKLDFGSSLAGHPTSSLTYFNKNLYGTTSEGGTTGAGAIFKYDLAAKTTTVEVNFDTINGFFPMGDLLQYDNKFYSTTQGGGIYRRGVVFSYDLISKTFLKLHDFDSAGGGNRTGFPSVHYGSSPLLLYNGKIYGTTHYGGLHDAGVLYELDPVSNVYTKKIDFDPPNGKEPSGSLVAFNGKLYGMAVRGGISDEGVLFEYDPSGNTYTKKLDFQGEDRLSEQSGLSLFNNKLYGVSAYGSVVSEPAVYGFLFEYDPVSNVYTRRLSFDSATGYFPYARLMLKNNIFYGMTAVGGAYDKGVLYQYDPVNNVYTKTADFDSTNSGAGPDMANLISIPADVADGTISTCTSLPPFIVDNTNSNGWRAITDQVGNAVAEINPNGNDLGNVLASLYVQNNPVRNIGGLNYLNRSLTISVQNQPAADHPVDVRLYIKKTELDDLINTPGSGINSVNDLVVYKSENTCSNTIDNDVMQLNTAAADWGANYVLTTQVNSFSTFHFSSANAALPVTLLNFSARRKNRNDVQLNWETSAESNSSYFNIERSTDGTHFTTIGKQPAAGTTSTKMQYQFIDAYAMDGDLFYRLNMVDKDGKFKYSKIVKLTDGSASGITVLPNPVQNTIIIKGADRFSQLQIIDASGKTIRQFAMNTANQYNVTDLKRGLYILRLVNDKGVVVARFIKQ